MASWTILKEQTVRISPRATSFTVVCEACAQLATADGYLGAAVTGLLPIDSRRGSIECPRGHRLNVEREGR